MIKTSKSRAGTQRVTFSLPVGAPPGRVSVVGSFNDWTPGRHHLTPRSNGRRSTSVDVAPGTVLQFRYLGEDGHWFDDPDLPDRADGNCVYATN
ncbi:isoamylase [Amycolatopsis kentuckyensis]|uniref:isoamylase n=1 Tax=Amycolatopsis kentuckyensis TaxID=218823 RepID=UPI0035616B09